MLRDLAFSLVVFVLPEPMSRFLASKGITTVWGVPVQDWLQIFLPQPLQLITSPLHFLGVSYVAASTRHLQLSLAQHLENAFREFWLRVGIRCVRVLVPYCFGAVANRRLRSRRSVHLCIARTFFSSERQRLPMYNSAAYDWRCRKIYSVMKNGLMLAGVGFMAQQRLALTGPVVPRLTACNSLRISEI